MPNTAVVPVRTVWDTMVWVCACPRCTSARSCGCADCHRRAYEGCVVYAASYSAAENGTRENYNMSVTALSTIVSVPVLLPRIKLQESAERKKEQKDRKAEVMRQRKKFLEQTTAAYTREHNARVDALAAPKPSGNRCWSHSYGRSVNSYIVGGTYDGNRVYAMGTDGLLFVQCTPRSFRKQSYENETEFQRRITREFEQFVNSGMSMNPGFCSCSNCCNQRSDAAYKLAESGPLDASIKRQIVEWDRYNNPWSKNYENRTRGGTFLDEYGNVQSRRQLRNPDAARGAGSGGALHTDPKARGGAARLVGLEVEHNRNVRSYLEPWLTNWSGAQIISDGSCGEEAVTPPIAGENVRKCVTELMKVLNDKKAGCDARCGLHIHVDARDMAWQDMLRFLTIYCRLEPLLFLIGGQNRYANTGGYCSPVAELYAKALTNSDPKGSVLAAAILSESNTLRQAAEARKLMATSPPDKKGGGRYKAINIMPWIAGHAYDRRDTTVEFRLHRGSHNAERVIHWAYICQDMVDWAIRSSNADVDKLPKSAAKALAVISPRCKGWVIRRLLGWRKSTTAGPEAIEDDVGNTRPKRLVSMKGGLYRADLKRL